jgi:hypothetical protein
MSGTTSTSHPPATANSSPLEAVHAPYFVQKTVVSQELASRSRVEVFAQLCARRRVLHVGCVDWPITDVRSSLHVQLDPHCVTLDGLDVHPEGFDALRPHLRGRLFSDWTQVEDEYDLVLVPEVLEHVADVAGFLRQLDALRAPHFVLTVPDAYSCMRGHFDYLAAVETFVEVVHPDHNCWYTPYTFANVVRKYTDWRIDGMWFFNRMSLLMIASRPRPTA